MKINPIMRDPSMGLGMAEAAKYAASDEDYMVEFEASYPMGTTEVFVVRNSELKAVLDEIKQEDGFVHFKTVKVVDDE